MALSKWKLWQNLIRTLLKRPRQVLRAVNWSNLKTLYYAIRYEPAALIWQNFLHLVRQDKNRLYRQRNLIEDGYVKVYFENTYRMPSKLYLSGWVIGLGKTITQVIVYEAQQPIGTFIPSFERDDVSRKYGNSYLQSGFQFMGDLSSPNHPLSLEIQFVDSEAQRISIPETDYDELYQTKLKIEESDALNLNRLNRQFRKNNKNPFSIYLQATKKQWDILVPETHTYPFTVILLSDKPADGYIVQLHPAAIPHPDLLWIIGRTILMDRPACIYWDEDELRPDGRRVKPHFKPDFNLTYLLGWNYIGYNFCYKASLASDIEKENVHPLEIMPQIKPDAISHITTTLTHQPQLEFRDPVEEENVRQKYLHKYHPEAQLATGLLADTWRIKYPITTPEKVTIIIPFRDQVALLRQCLSSLQTFNTYPNISLFLIDNQSIEPETHNYLRQVQTTYPDCRVVLYDQPFNYAAMHNWAIDQIDSPYVLLLNNDTEFFQPYTIESLLEYAQHPEVGAVGAKLLFPDHTIQHAGVIVGIHGVADHAHKYLPAAVPGYFYRANTPQELSACTAACLLMKTHLYRQVGGMDATSFPIAFNDIDLCLKLVTQGYDIIYTPYACLFHHESVSRGIDLTPQQKRRAQSEIKAFRKKWRTFLTKGDPFYHIKFSIRSGHFELSEI